MMVMELQSSVCPSLKFLARADHLFIGLFFLFFRFRKACFPPLAIFLCPFSWLVRLAVVGIVFRFLICACHL